MFIKKLVFPAFAIGSAKMCMIRLKVNGKSKDLDEKIIMTKRFWSCMEFSAFGWNFGPSVKFAKMLNSLGCHTIASFIAMAKNRTFLSRS